MVKSPFDIIKDLVSNKIYKVTQIAKGTGIPEARIYKWLDEKTKSKPKTEDNLKLEKWLIEMEVIPHGTSEMTFTELILDVKEIKTLVEYTWVIISKMRAEQLKADPKKYVKNLEGKLNELLKLADQDEGI